MHAQLEVGRQAVAPRRERQDRDIVVELPLEKRDIPHVVHAFVKAAGEPWCNSLRRDSRSGEGRQNDQQLRRGLGLTGFVHGNLGYERPPIPALRDAAINSPRFLGGEEVLAGGFGGQFPRHLQRLFDSGDGQPPGEFGMAAQERFHLAGRNRLADAFGYIDGVKVAGVDKTVHRGEVDVVRVHVVGLPPVRLPNGGVGRQADAGRLRPDDSVLAVGLVPDRDDGEAALRGHDARLQLGARLLPEPVAHAERELAKAEHGPRRQDGAPASISRQSNRLHLQALATASRRRFSYQHIRLRRSGRGVSFRGAALRPAPRKSPSVTICNIGARYRSVKPEYRKPPLSGIERCGNARGPAPLSEPGARISFAMPRLPLFLFPGVSLLLFSAVAMEEGNWFPLQPVRDDFQPNILDVSRFVEAPTGKHGFLAVKDDQFAFQDGAPARFWGSQVNAMGKEQVDYMVRRMRRQGINITRLHGLESLNDRNGKTSSDYDAASWDRMDYLIYKLGENGIYIILDTDYPLNYRIKPGDEIPGMPEGGPAPYAEFFDAKVASVLQRRMAEILTHVNPYTKKRYCDDPTVAMVEVLNEDSLFWGEVPQRYHDRIEGMFKAWMKTRRGEEAAAKATWQTNRNLLFQQLQANPEKLAMAQDQLRFMEGLEEKYWTGSRDAMRKAGLKVPVAATNWQGHGSPTTRVHMLGQSKVDYIDRHGYWDHPQGEGNLRWNIAPAQFHTLPMVKDVKADQDHLVYLGVENLVTEKAWEQVLGMPMTISEWNTCLPNEYSLESTGLMAAYSLLH